MQARHGHTYLQTSCQKRDDLATTFCQESGVAFKECIAVYSMGPNFLERSCLGHLPASVDVPCAGAGKAGPS